MAGAGVEEPLSEAIVKAGDSILGDRAVAAIGISTFILAFWLMASYAGLDTYRTPKILFCLLMSGLVTTYSYFAMKKRRQKRRHQLELEIRASREQETQRQLSEMRAKIGGGCHEPS